MQVVLQIRFLLGLCRSSQLVACVCHGLDGYDVGFEEYELGVPVA